MKGPFERLKYELRRIWECPKCHRRIKSPGSQTAMFCRCSEGDPAIPMALVGDGARRIVPPVVLIHEPIVLGSGVVTALPPASIPDVADPSSEPSAESVESQSVPEAPPISSDSASSDSPSDDSVSS
jgi:hypothetical protein